MDLQLLSVVAVVPVVLLQVGKNFEIVCSQGVCVGLVCKVEFSQFDVYQSQLYEVEPFCLCFQTWGQVSDDVISWQLTIVLEDLRL